ncbi:hypothetical protein [Rariglobus hedericola]|uniref:Uncharacterized protein n=1 Tax=Rariglobus hedericola TaxID=2597822 RepID=A0A556QPQ4_9BACT|nr:hypothetical protein [Rariglobus hedericola]TSJ78620.1 hypothetical protein FPL22_04770 [Rariglobus hedericola]
MTKPNISNIIAFGALIISALAWNESRSMGSLQTEQVFEQMRDDTLSGIRLQIIEARSHLKSFETALQLASSKRDPRYKKSIESAIVTCNGQITQLEGFYKDIESTKYSEDLGLKYWFGVRRELRNMQESNEEIRSYPAKLIQILQEVENGA